MITVFAKHITNRVRYAFELYFEELLQVPVSFTDRPAVFAAEPGIKINYSDRDLPGCLLTMRPHPLLFRQGIYFEDLSGVVCNDQPCWFRSSDDSFLSFDLFAAGFFLVTRYEEYLERQFGKHRRYPARHSVLFRYQLLGKPVVNEWARLLASKIGEAYPDFRVPSPRFQFLMTIDVDNAWAYRHKSLVRLAGASAKSLLAGRFRELTERFRVWAGNAPDPYDTYDYIDRLYRGNEHHLQFFVLIGKPGRFDRNVSPKKEAFRQLIGRLAADYQVGLHPSYRSNRIKRELARERKLLETMIGRPVTSSRQHYLKLILPSTYRRLIKAGIREDHTMGYAECSGFRAGIASPFWFYDLHEEQKTNLRVVPFQFMDISLRDYLKLSPDEALEHIKKMMHEVARSGGTFISLWHNESLSDLGAWKGWRRVFEESTALGLALQNG